MKAGLVPAAAYKYMTARETPAICERLHPARLLPRAVTAAGALLSAVALEPAVSGHGWVELAVWLITGWFFLSLARAVLDRFSTYLVVTRWRIFLCSGSGVTWTASLADVKDIRVIRSPAGRIAGFGTLILDPAHVAIDYVPYPEQMYVEMLGLIHPDPPELD
ncbi:MAG: hypothetical protein J2P25_16100 [Nocardiopsaceae bacterium]|nr:hypothetical protein [Nocardiopsaceae bacterium]